MILLLFFFAFKNKFTFSFLHIVSYNFGSFYCSRILINMERSSSETFLGIERKLSDLCNPDFEN